MTSRRQEISNFSDISVASSLHLHRLNCCNVAGTLVIVRFGSKEYGSIESCWQFQLEVSLFSAEHKTGFALLLWIFVCLRETNVRCRTGVPLFAVLRVLVFQSCHTGLGLNKHPGCSFCAFHPHLFLLPRLRWIQNLHR